MVTSEIVDWNEQHPAAVQFTVLEAPADDGAFCVTGLSIDLILSLPKTLRTGDILYSGLSGSESVRPEKIVNTICQKIGEGNFTKFWS